VASPLIHHHCGIRLTKLLRPAFPQTPLPLSPDGIDFHNLLKTVVSHFSTARLAKAYEFAWKKSEITGLTGKTHVLKEAVYSQEFAAILLSWFPDTATIAPEASCHERDEADIFMTVGANKVVFEFCANERFAPESKSTTFLGHVQRGRRYAEFLQATACVIHFVGVKAFPDPLKAWNNSDERLLPSDSKSFFAYVFHTHDFTQAKILVWSVAEKQQVIPVTFVISTLEL